MPCPVAAAVLDVDVCQPQRCPSDCDPQDECVVVAVTSVDAVTATPEFMYNLFAGDLDEWLSRSITGWTHDATAVLCLGKFSIVVSTGETAIKVSDDLMEHQIEIDEVDVTDWVAHAPVQIDGIDQTFIVICGLGGYVYGSYGAGTTWETLDAGVATGQNLNRIMIARDNPEVIYAVGDNNTIIKSTNGGENWFELTGPCGLYSLEDITALWVATQNRVMVGTDAGEVFTTLDGGETWSQQNDLPQAAADTTVTDIVACGCGIYWLTLQDDVAAQHIVYRNVDGGASGRWYIPAGITIGGLYGSPPYPPLAVACCGANRATVVGGVPNDDTGFVMLLA